MIDHLFDLEQTYTLNMEILQNLICDNFKNQEKYQLLNYFDRIKNLKEKKKKSIDEKLRIRGKILLNKQIYEEHKRIREETESLHVEQEDEVKELVESKFCSIKELEKKFQEVDIYMKKHYPNVYSYEILKIVETNENLINKKIKFKKEIDDERENINEILVDNQQMSKNKESDLESVLKKDSAENKLKSMKTLIEGKVKKLMKIKEKLYNLKENLGTSKTQIKAKKRIDNVNLSVIGKRAISSINLNVSNIDYKGGPETPIGKNAFFDNTILLRDGNDTTNFGNQFGATFIMNKTSDIGLKDQLWDLSIIKKDTK